LDDDNQLSAPGKAISETILGNDRWTISDDGKRSRNFEPIPRTFGGSFLENAVITKGYQSVGALKFSDDKLDQIMHGGELVFSPPVTGEGPLHWQIMGIGIDQAEWLRQGEEPDYRPLHSLRGHFGVGLLDTYFIFRRRGEERKPRLKIKDVSWNGQDVEVLAKDWAKNWVERDPGKAIPVFVALGAGGLAGAYYYGRQKGPIAFNAGTYHVLKREYVDVTVKPRAEIGTSTVIGLRGGEVKLSLKPLGIGKFSARVIYDRKEKVRLEANLANLVGPPILKGQFNVGAWSQPDTGDWGVGLFFGMRW
ncbi:MAG: hypothetical protein HY692_09870, partial [Cyanobacteria bacterium NC_groundwater_1444_Ag_S-0.65um_54_12]|nr:hypothetical protein [Cyanobacteria bacterium NC_groundwater_1444_Ag_S-0.65um_54_12]